ncbi:uncharacterized protein LOC131243336 isoform X2 [Magnolia sinica]|uniref:uncharacterized protein LOC131243336 isoform X2 n=1 Tax=Magnolia sinica TaxID=86752 RepID=UPI00265AD909|nr:uncharacterized protein LOC131243336 isoform X2 [Magnolia sinica]
MSVENGTRSSEEDARKEDENILLFLDSMDSYLTLFDSLSSTLRQGWLELASARHSMGTSRITSALFDLKLHSAATTLQVNLPYDESASDVQEKDSETNGKTLAVDDQIQKERSKSLSVFGTLVSPKLRSAQVSFETALETLVKMANMRSSMLSAYAQTRQEMEGAE